ncbi:MAG: hypothetical protein LUQ37_09540 [Methanoregulaceae archaeon]|nr:hypothetical protein [Methanoregulaceae archaeon]
MVERLEIVRLNRHDQINQPLLRFFRAGVQAAGDDGFAVGPGNEEAAVASDAGEVDSESAASSVLMLRAIFCPRSYDAGPFMILSTSATCSRTAFCNLSSFCWHKFINPQNWLIVRTVCVFGPAATLAPITSHLDFWLT